MMGGGGMMGWGGGWAGSGGWGGSSVFGLAGGGLLTLLLWVGLIAVGIVAVRWFRDTSRPDAAPEASALEILKRRYARGEIGRDEFETKKRDLV